MAKQYPKELYERSTLLVLIFPENRRAMAVMSGQVRGDPRISATLNEPSAEDDLDDEDFPAYSMGRAAELLGVTQAFLRSLDAAKLVARCVPIAGIGVTPGTSCGSRPVPES